MAKITLKYATHSEFKALLPYVNEFDTKQPIYRWETTGTSNLYLARNSGLVSQLYINGENLGDAEANSGVLNVTGEWYYDSSLDTVYYFDESNNPSDVLMESGQDWSTLVTNSLVNATMELNSMLDARFPIPIPQTLQYSNTVASDTPEYDYIIIKLTCYIAGINLIRASNPSDERADALQEQVDAIMEKLNKGDIKLRFEVDATDKGGEIIVGPSNGGTMYLVETYCEEWTGAPYEKVEIECNTTGIYGIGTIDVKVLDGEKLSGATILTNFKVTGGLQNITNGLWIRFEGNSITDGDKWWIPIRQRSLLTTNTQVTTLRAIRK